MELLFEVLPLLLAGLLVVIGMLVGYINEKNHYRSIKQREAQFAQQPCLSIKQLTDSTAIQSAYLVQGSVVISVDHWKRLLAGLRSIFGGEVKAYSSLVDRARREATLRMKEMAPNADLYINYRIETSTLSNSKGNSIGCVESLAYATAIIKR